MIEFLNKGGGIDEVVNIQRSRKFFDKWLAAYGDDSIAELGGVHLSLEGLSNIASQEIEDKRIGISPLEKSTRYVSFRDKRVDGKYKYHIPGEIKNTPLEKTYIATLDLLFDTYDQISDPYLEYIKELYPQGEDETPTSFHNSRSAKRFDDIRDLLPFATQTNVALFGNGRAYEDVINRLLTHPVGELCWWGKAIADELEKAVPSFVRRPKTARGAEVQNYRNNLRNLREELTTKICGTSSKPAYQKWVKLVQETKNADVEILSTFLTNNSGGFSLSEIRRQVQRMPYKKRSEYLREIINERKMNNADAPRQEVRFRKVPRAFENAHYLFEIWGRGGDYRDLHRHRALTQERHFFTTKWGYDLEPEVLNSPFIEKIEIALEKAAKLFQKLATKSPWIAQYIVPFGFVQHWYMHMTAREIYWIVELRTGPQGRPHYRHICQQIAREATKASPSVFSGLMVDTNEYNLSRRESEKKIEKKLKSL
jgi:thymidylate synthase ThyX